VERSLTLTLNSAGRKKPEEELVSMNLGLGASLVLLLSRSAVELNKMVELRAQMEALVSEIRHAAQWKENANHPAGAPTASTSRESNGSSATTANVKDPIAFPAADADAASNCSRTTADNAVSGRAAAVVIDQLEAELQAELGRMQRGTDRTAHGGGGDERIAPMQGLEVRSTPVNSQQYARRTCARTTIQVMQHAFADHQSIMCVCHCRQLPLLKVKTKAGNAIGSTSRSRVVDGGGARDGEVVDGNAEEEEEEEYEEAEEEDEEEEEEEGGYDEDRSSPPHGGVSARALERRLHELLQKRQQERIVELESALDAAQRRLHEKEREVVWWRDAAKLVSHRRDESRRFVR
jgi:hypothetical protein